MSASNFQVKTITLTVTRASKYVYNLHTDWVLNHTEDEYAYQRHTVGFVCHYNIELQKMRDMQ